MQTLNLPACDLSIEDGTVWDIIRKKRVVLTPEEWVRQHLVHLLILHLGYPKSMIKVESGLRYNGRDKRSDIQVMRPDGSVFLLLECKSPEIIIDKKTVNQVSLYNKTLQSEHMAISNGIKHFIWKYDGGGFKQLRDFPGYSS